MKYEADSVFCPAYCEDDATRVMRHPVAREFSSHIALIGCFRPRQCGIATFTADTYDQLTRTHPEIAVDVYAMRASPAQPGDAAVRQTIDEANPASYRAAGEAINASGADAVWLQHEFGIYGGAAGEMVFELVDRLAAPLIVTLHTVLAEPDDAQRRVMERLVARASRLVVMSDFGRRTLVDVYGASPEAVVHIEHGTPDRPYLERSPLRGNLGIRNRPVLSTFGLIGPGKGLETAIRALPAIAAQYPDILYRIVGATHPNLVAAEGEAYRESLEALAESLGVAGNIAWENRFLDTGALLDQIELCDIYLAPYPNLAQVTSGTLAYAVALGRAVVSTPFVHARELLANDVGILLPQVDSDAIAEAVLLLLAVPEERSALQARAYARGRRTAWPVIAEQFVTLIGEAIAKPAIADTRAMPSLEAVAAMSDDVGILQHGCGIVPDRNHGYCIDDNARALMLITCLGERSGDRDRLALRYASFLQHGWNTDARRFRNFMSYDRRWLEDQGSEDSNGRALWALGHCAGRSPEKGLADWALAWFDRAAEMAAELKSPRAVAFAMLGADGLLDRHPGHMGAQAIMERGSALLYALWKLSRRPGWDWFEAGLSYDNARLAEALIRAGRRAGSVPFEEAGIAALDWLCGRQTSAKGFFRPAGSEGFGREEEALPFDQQPLEAWATIAACGQAFGSTGSARWRESANAAWRWFFGANDRGAMLGSVRSGRCFDGLTPRGVNANVGAESTLAFHLAWQEMQAHFWNGARAKTSESRPDAVRELA
ncbi:glycosyltransferase family 4 protein [Sphingopyxis sp.]|uniref:glycosyltransferase family 4 protein n=1 Tax=Sphingopyxis sp. TaxID=1908224 RepID=UPI002D77D822|nr:glycosyltransferase family 4 protein [Sphingopyxis sp.]HET6526861.1 glycosyltransferase family 4 protein [Sphingopyxis sp.]